MKKIVEYLEKAYNVLADLFAEPSGLIDPIGPGIGLIVTLLLLPLLLEILGV